MTEPSLEILLVQHDQHQVDQTLDVLRSHHLATRIHVVHDGAEALELLFGSGPYADQQPPTPRLVLFHLRLAAGDDLEVLAQLASDPLTCTLPVTVLADTPDDRRAAIALLRDNDLNLPVIVIGELASRGNVRALPEGSGVGPTDDDGAWIVGGAERRPSREPTPAPAPLSTGDDADVQRDLESLTRLARGVAHEFNNLLSVVVAYTELLVKDMDLDDPRRAGAEEIFKSIGRASRLTRELLTFNPAAARSLPDQRPAAPRVVRRSHRASAG
jgi:signal transduction histidine kinase